MTNVKRRTKHEKRKEKRSLNEILNISNVHGYMDKQTGTAYLNAEDVARGFGFTTVAKSGNEVVRWARVNTYLHEFGSFPTCWER